MAIRQYKGRTKVYMQSSAAKEFVATNADYVRAANLLNLTCDPSGDIGFFDSTSSSFKTDIAAVKKYIGKQAKPLFVKYHPDKGLGDAGQACLVELTAERDLLKEAMDDGTLSSHVCDGSDKIKIEGNDKNVGDPIHKVFAYCNDPLLAKDFTNYDPPHYMDYLPHEVAQVNHVLKQRDPSFDFHAVDPAVQGEIMEVAALLEEFWS